MKNIHPILMYSDFYSTEKVPDMPLRPLLDFNMEQVVLVFILIKNALDPKVLPDTRHDTIKRLVVRLPEPKQKRLLSFLGNLGIPYALTHSLVITKILADVLPLIGSNVPTTDIESPLLESAVLDVILIYNQFHYQGVLEQKPDDHETIWKLLLMQDITGVDEVDYTRTSLPKQLIFSNFLKTVMAEQYLSFECELKEITGLSDIHEFLLILLNVYLTASKKDGVISIAKSDRAYQILIDADLVIDSTMAKEKTFGIQTLISHPFFRTSDGQMYLIDCSDFALILDKIWSFFLFTKTKVRTYLPNVTDLNSYLSFLGRDYVEGFLMRKLFGSLEKLGCRIIFSDDVNLPDFTMILNERDIFIFELKASALHFNILKNKDVQGFKKFIDDNFSSGRKGSKQLANNLEYLASDAKNLYGLRTETKNITIYPIILFTDPHLTKNGVNDYVNELAKNKFEPQKINFKEVKDLTMIHIDFFIENIMTIQHSPSILKRTINAYHKDCRKKMAQYNKFRSTAKYMDAKNSFDRFVAGKEKLYRLDKMVVFDQLNKIFALREGHST